MSVFGDLAAEMDAIRANARERDQQATFLRSLAEHPAETLTLIDIVSRWGDHAPTLPPGAILGLAHGGIEPESPTGQSIIRNGVPALHQPAGAMDRAAAAAQGSTLDQMLASGQYTGTLAQAPEASISQGHPFAAPAPDYVGDPNYGSGISGAIQRGLGAIPGLIGEANANLQPGLAGNRQMVGHDLASAVEAVRSGVPNRLFTQAQSTASGLTPNPQSPKQVQAMGPFNPEAAKAAARETFAVANTGLQATTIPLKLAAAATNEYVRHNPAGSTYRVPFTGAEFTVGSMSDAVNPEQFTLYQQLHGKSLGEGILPGGEATAAATAAQQRAGNINGHALTYGRVLASVAVEPGTRPYSILSGLIDAGVVMNLDPAANLLKAASEAKAASGLFTGLPDTSAATVAHYLVDNARTSEAMTGLTDFARADGDHLIEALADRAKTDPGSVANVAKTLGIGDPKGLYRAAAGPQAGLFHSLRPRVHQDTALQYLSSKSGDQLVTWLRNSDSVTAIRSRLGEQFPVDLIPALKNATTDEQVRSLLSTELGTTLAGAPSMRWIRPPEQLRMFSQMPKEWMDYTNNQQVVQQAERYLALTKYPKENWDGVLEPIMGAANLGEMRNAVERGLGPALQEHLVAGGAPPRLARELVRFHTVQSEQQRMFLVDDLGQPVRASGIAVDGEPVPITGPFSWNELARGAAPLDARALRQSTQKYRQLLHFWNDGYLSDAATIPDVRRQIERAVEAGEPLSTREIARRYAAATGTKVSRVTHELVSAESYISQQLTSYFKGMTLSAVRVPVRFLADEQMAMSVSGIDSMLSGHPLSYLAIATGAKAAHDIEAVPFVDYAADLQSSFARALGAAAKDSPSPWTTEQQMLKQFVTYGKADKHYVRGWIDNVSQLHLSPPDREVARAILDPTHVPAGVEGQGLDAVKEWFATGPGTKYLEDLQGADLGWGSKYLHSRAVSDAYVDQLRDKVMLVTGGDQTLLDAAAHGTPFDFKKMNQGIAKSVDHDFRTYLADHLDLGPTVVKARAAAGRKDGRLFDWITDKLLGALMDVPARTLTRSPAFRQYYYRQVERLLPFMRADAQELALRNAAEDGMMLTRPAANGALELHDANMIAQAHALAKMKTYLYYPGEKTTAEDILRNVMPFAPAWRSVIKRWSTLAVEHPQIVRYGQAGVQSLQSSGFFHPEPGLGTGDFFTMGGPGFVKAITGATGFTMEGSVAGLNMFTGTWATTHGLPGVGPVVQYPAAILQSHTPIGKAIHDFVSPYGDPDTSGGFFESLFPGWLNKLRAGGWLGPIGPTAQQQVVRDDLVKQVFETAVSSGRYDLSNLDVLQKLFDQSKAQADRLYLLRGLAQFAAPTAPQFSAKATLKDGRSITLYKISAHYSDLIKQFKGDTQKATVALLNDYGPDLIYAARPKNLNLVGGGLHDAAAVTLWKQQHSDFAAKYPSLFGFWVPPGSANRTGGSPQDYFDLIKSGDIAPLSVEQWAKAADQYLGNVIYSELRAKLPPSLTHAQRDWLAAQSIRIQKIHPFYRQELGLPSKATRQQQIVQLYGLPGEKGALDDPAIRDTPLARTAKAYLSYRDQALVANRKNPVTGTLAAKNMAPIRDWLYKIGTELARRNPDFIPMWNSLLQPEVDPNG